MKKRTWTRRFWTGFTVILLLGAYGCADFFSSETVREREPETRQTVTTSYRFEDIPIPSDMTLLRRDSFVYEAGRIKTGLIIYETKGELTQLAGFFKKRMPQYQWKLLSSFELNNVMLIFIKEGMAAVIYILPQEGLGQRVEIRVGPVEMKLLAPS